MEPLWHIRCLGAIWDGLATFSSSWESRWQPTGSFEDLGSCAHFSLQIWSTSRFVCQLPWFVRPVLVSNLSGLRCRRDGLQTSWSLIWLSESRGRLIKQLANDRFGAKECLFCNSTGNHWGIHLPGVILGAYLKVEMMAAVLISSLLQSIGFKMVWVIQSKM